MNTFTTLEYSIFNVAINKPLNLGHVETLKKSISDKDLGEYFPIDCIRKEDGTISVVNGQHRLAARKALNLPIYYQITGLTFDEIRKAESLTKTWTKEDYISYFADLGIPSYVLMKKLEIETGWKFGGIAHYFAHKLKTNVESFNKGLALYTQQDYEICYNAISLHKEIANILPFQVNKRTMFSTCLHLIKLDDFDKSRMISKLKQFHSLVYPCLLSDQYLELLEKVYNYRCTKAQFTLLRRTKR